MSLHDLFTLLHDLFMFQHDLRLTSKLTARAIPDAELRKDTEIAVETSMAEAMETAHEDDPAELDFQSAEEAQKSRFGFKSC